MRVLVACEFSGVVRNAFLALGHDAYSCDYLPGLKPTHDRHLRQGVEPLLELEWDLVIAHPPCTYLCNSGVRWLTDKKHGMGRHGCMVLAAMFFRKCLAANSSRVCVENPIQHRYAKHIIKIEPSQTIQPWMFGHGETKATCLWLKGLPLLSPTNVVDGRKGAVHLVPPGAFQGIKRSITYSGIAEAMAQQWGGDERP